MRKLVFFRRTAGVGDRVSGASLDGGQRRRQLPENRSATVGNCVVAPNQFRRRNIGGNLHQTIVTSSFSGNAALARADINVLESIIRNADLPSLLVSEDGATEILERASRHVKIIAVDLMDAISGDIRKGAVLNCRCRLAITGRRENGNCDIVKTAVRQCHITAVPEIDFVVRHRRQVEIVGTTFNRSARRGDKQELDIFNADIGHARRVLILTDVIVGAGEQLQLCNATVVPDRRRPFRRAVARAPVAADRLDQHDKTPFRILVVSSIGRRIAVEGTVVRIQRFHEVIVAEGVHQLVAIRAELAGLDLDELLVIVGLHRIDAKPRITVIDNRLALRRGRIDRQAELELLPFRKRLTVVEVRYHVERRGTDDHRAARDIFHDLRRRDGDHVQHVQLVRVVGARHALVAHQLGDGGVDLSRV